MLICNQKKGKEQTNRQIQRQYAVMMQMEFMKQNTGVTIWHLA